MWPAPAATRSPSTLATHYGATATPARERPLSQSVRGGVVSKSSVSKPSSVQGNHRTDLFGVALHFGSVSSVKALPTAVADAAGFASAQVIVSSGAFDRSLRHCQVGEVKGSVRFQFDHVDDTKTASTISGTLKLFADQKALSFYVTGSTRDGANSVKWARTFADLREVSAGFYIRRFNVIPAGNGEPPTIDVTEAELFEISLVARGAFPRTSFKFL